jgi:GrpB-like predicted nucleotidyltransferase (UPF0157 family)
MYGEVRRQDHVPPGFDMVSSNWTKFFFMQRPGSRRANIHVRESGRPNQRYAVLVRDFLRSDSRTAQAYAELKKRLSVSLANSDAYPEVKDPVSDIIYLSAERWAKETNWAVERASEA